LALNGGGQSIVAGTPPNESNGFQKAANFAGVTLGSPLPSRSIKVNQSQSNPIKPDQTEPAGKILP
jgi:hypothetical protein